MGHPLTPQNVNVYRYGNRTQRQCKACNRRLARLRMRQRRAEGHYQPDLAQLAEYRRRYRAELRTGTRTVKRRNKKRIQLKPQLADFLEIAGGWWTVAALANRFNVAENSVRKALASLATEGSVQTDDRAGRKEWKHT